MNILIGQIGLNNLSEQEKLEFIDYLNEQLKKDDAGFVAPNEGRIIKKDILGIIEHADAVIDVISYTIKAVKTAKRLPYFYQQAQIWLKLKGKKTSPESLKKMADFLDKPAKEINKDAD